MRDSILVNSLTVPTYSENDGNIGRSTMKDTIYIVFPATEVERKASVIAVFVRRVPTWVI